LVADANPNLKGKILVTGFEPFQAMTRNPSREIALELNGQIINDYLICGAELPVDCDTMPALLYGLLEETKPVAIISLGLAAGRNAISLEWVGVNLMDWNITDNAGHIKHDTPIISDGPAAYLASLPLRSIQRTLANAEIPCYLSASAGLYLCNQALYLAAHYAATQQPDLLTGFIHLPCLPEMILSSEAAKTPSMSYNLQLKAIQLAIVATIGALD